MQWLTEEGELIVNKQVVIYFSFNKYKDEVLYDVVPATHIHLGKPWQNDRKTFHDGLTNKISFHLQGHKIILKPLSPKEVNKDQLKMKQKRKYEKDDKNNKTGFITLPNVKIVMLIRQKINTANLGLNSFQLGGQDTNQLDKQMTKDITDSSQLGQSSQHTRQDPTKSQKKLSRGRTGHEPKYQLFFLLVFLQDKLKK